MATIVTRAGKGSPLTNAEVDANFLNLNAELATKQGTLVSGTSIKTVNGQSVLGSGNIQIDGGVTSFNTRTGAVSLSSGDVTGALGFTPYNATNPSGYTSNTGTVTSVGGTGTVSGLTLSGTVTGSGNLTLGGTLSLTSGNVTTALGFTPYNATNPSGYITSSGSISGNAATATALQTARTINGVSFNGTANITILDGTKLPLAGGTMTGGLTVGGNLGLSGNPGGVRVISPTAGTNTTLVLEGASTTGASANIELTSDNLIFLDGTQSRFRSQDGSVGFLNISSGATNVLTGALQQQGNQVLHAGNYTSYAPSLTGGGASGTWGINITGNAATITSQANSATITASTGVNGNHIVQRDGNGYIYANHINFNTGVENPTIANFITDNGDGWSRKSSLAHVKNQIRGVADGTWSINITGSAGSAPANGGTATALSSGNFISQTGNTGTWNSDFQNTPAGTARYGGDVGAQGVNNPGGSWWIQQNFRHTNSGGFWGTQVAWGWEDNANRLATRNVQNGTFGAWVYYLNSSNFSSYALPLSGGTLSGTINAPNFINSGNSSYGIFGNNAYFDTVNGRGSDPLELNYYDGGPVKIGSGANGSKSLYAVGIYDNGSRVLSQEGGSYYQVNTWLQFNSTYGLYWPNHFGAHLHANDLSTYTQLAIRGSKNSYSGIYDQHSAVNIGMYDGGGNGGLYREANGRWYQYHNVSNNCTGFGTSSTNAAYGIWVTKGGYFDGRVDGTIFYDANNTGYYVDPTGGTSLRTVGDWRADSSSWTGEFAGKMQYHSSSWYLQFSSNMIFRNASGTNVMTCDSGGTVSFTGNVTAFSDERLKKDWASMPADFVERLAIVKSGTYTRIDSGERQAGSSAQDWEKLLPEVVLEGADDDKTLSLAYGNAALVSAVELAKYVTALEQRISQLEARL